MSTVSRETFPTFNEQSDLEREAKRAEFMRRAENANPDVRKGRYWLDRSTRLSRKGLIELGDKGLLLKK
jgi:hypothetical protein